MTQEEARKAAEILDAFANGKELEWCNNMGVWLPVVNPTFNFNDNKYRIKEEQKYRPFKNKEECLEEMMKHQPFGWVKKSDNVYYNIYTVSAIGIEIYDNPMFYNEAFKECIFIDGVPFGIKEE